MAAIDIQRRNGDNSIAGIQLSGESLDSHDGETWIVPKGLVSPDLLVNDLPRGERFEELHGLGAAVIGRFDLRAAALPEWFGLRSGWTGVNEADTGLAGVVRLESKSATG